MLIILPNHLCVSGITTWAINTVRGLEARGHRAGLVVHTRAGEEVPGFLKPYVVARVENAPDIGHLRGCLDALIPVYRSAIERMYEQTGKPTVVSPNVHGDCYGAIAAIALESPELVRVVSWIHSDNEYDIGVAQRYEPMIHAMVPVSRELGASAKRALPERVDNVVHIPHCVEVPEECPVRVGLDGRAVRLVYTGRLCEEQKRVSALGHLARGLAQRGIDFELRVVGDGPEMESVVSASKGIEQMQVLGAVAPEQVQTHLRWADVWVLPSRYEGQSVAMLEALAFGCVPVVTRVRSGASDVVIDGQTGLMVDAQWDTTGEEVGAMLCDGIERVMGMDIAKVSRNAHALALANHGVSGYLDRIEGLIERVIAMPDRAWPSDRRAAYSSDEPGLDESTPSDACDRMRGVLAGLAGKRVLIYCSGLHTRDVSEAIRGADVEIVGIVDDDPSKAGTGLIGYPIYPSSQIPELEATELVISSWIYENAIWNKRGGFEDMGVRVHRLYAAEDTPGAEIVEGAIRGV